MAGKEATDQEAGVRRLRLEWFDASLGTRFPFDSSNQLPVGVLTGLIGRPYVPSLVRNQRQLEKP